MDKKFDCYKCEYRGTVPGDSHSCCNHPANKEIMDDPFARIFGILGFGILGSVGRGPGILSCGKGLNIQGNPRGIRSGWFNYPVNFDPVWLENCDGFKKSSNTRKEEV